MKINLSMIIPVYNEEDLLEKNIPLFLNYLVTHPRIDKYEIIIVENGSTDNSPAITQKLAQRFHMIKTIHLTRKGIGHALSTGIKTSAYSYVYFNALDNPFHLQDLKDYLKRKDQADILFASKNNPKSIYEAKPVRKILSKTLSLLVKVLFDLPLTDTQGTFMGKREKLLQLLPFCTSTDSFFHTQMGIYAKLLNFKIAEIPVLYRPSETRKSKYNLLFEGMRLIYELSRERIKLSLAKFSNSENNS